ncbi:MAG: histidinol dehydrogenase [Clostridiales bacterium]|nr:histidinol dehydrogenase [Clostridiales bacterium]
MIRILDASKISEKDIFLRDASMPDVSLAVSKLILQVREQGDKALFELTKTYDKVSLTELEVTEDERQKALKIADPKLMEILKEAAENIKFYHSRQLKSGYEIREKKGIILGQRVRPLEKVGLYVPGGTASYPSTVLMNCIPAKLAGVEEIIMTTPPDENGSISPDIIAAAEIAGVDRIIKCGGAQAVAALAYGTESVPRVDKIVGPGNAYVAEAKRQVFGQVDIDMIAGPSEILIIADEKSSPKLLAADMLSQAEHDKLSTAVLICTSKSLAEEVKSEISHQLERLPRREIATESIRNNGKIILAESIEQAIEISNRIAPEHLELCVDKPFDYLNKITNAGSIFLGKNCPEPLGDYFAGTNHTLPTGGTARFSSPLSVDDFLKKSSYIYYSEEALNEVCDKIAYFAEKEGLSAHARSAVSRKNRMDESET